MMQTFEPMNPFFWVLFFGSIIGYVYLATQSLMASVVVIILVLGTFSGTAISGFFADVPVFTQFLYIVTLFGFTSLIFGIILKRRF